VSWYATATGRFGYAFERSLIFLHGGAAFARQKDDSAFQGVIDTQETRNVAAGWTIGGGIEHYFAPNWSVKVEYDFMDFGKKSYAAHLISIAVAHLI
jgi:outer membrane immunogenic protein